jgi:hypothetical protein
MAANTNLSVSNVARTSVLHRDYPNNGGGERSSQLCLFSGLFIHSPECPAKGISEF